MVSSNDLYPRGEGLDQVDGMETVGLLNKNGYGISM